MNKMREGVSNFSVEFFCLTVQTEFVGGGGPLVFDLFRVSKKFGKGVRGGGSFKIFRRKFFVSQCRKSS